MHRKHDRLFCIIQSTLVQVMEFTTIDVQKCPSYGYNAFIAAFISFYPHHHHIQSASNPHQSDTVSLLNSILATNVDKERALHSTNIAVVIYKRMALFGGSFKACNTASWFAAPTWCSAYSLTVFGINDNMD